MLRIFETGNSFIVTIKQTSDTSHVFRAIGIAEFKTRKEAEDFMEVLKLLPQLAKAERIWFSF